MTDEERDAIAKATVDEYYSRQGVGLLVALGILGALVFLGWILDKLPVCIGSLDKWGWAIGGSCK